MNKNFLIIVSLISLLVGLTSGYLYSQSQKNHIVNVDLDMSNLELLVEELSKSLSSDEQSSTQSSELNDINLNIENLTKALSNIEKSLNKIAIFTCFEAKDADINLVWNEMSKFDCNNP